MNDIHITFFCQQECSDEVTVSIQAYINPKNTVDDATAVEMHWLVFIWASSTNKVMSPLGHKINISRMGRGLLSNFAQTQSVTDRMSGRHGPYFLM